MSSTTATATGHVPLDDEPSLDPLDSGEFEKRQSGRETEQQKWNESRRIKEANV